MLSFMHARYLRLLAWHALGGAAVGLGAAAALVALDVGHLFSLVTGANGSWVAAAMLGFGFAVTFGSASLGAAIMGLGERRRPPADGRRIGATAAARLAVPAPR